MQIFRFKQLCFSAGNTFLNRSDLAIFNENVNLLTIVRGVGVNDFGLFNYKVHKKFITEIL